GGVARFPLLALDDRVHLDRRRRADRAPHEAAARMTCTACGRSTARPLYAVAGFTIARCECGLARTELPPGFDPAAIYTESYFQGGQHDGYADYTGSERELRYDFRRTLEALPVRGGKLVEL